MLTITTIFGIVLVVAALIQWVFSALFQRYFRKLTTERAAVDCQAPAAVVMCVRGCDPSLARGLQGILNQKYANYQIHLVIDSRTDTAWTVAHQIKQKHDAENRLHIHELRDRSPTCGLKCSALVQGIGFLPVETKYLLLTDSDVTTHPFWMADLIGPLENDPDIGIVMGTQWFEPAAGSTWGALVRSAWNAGAMVPTIFFRNPWAGTTGMRLEDIQRGDFVDTWKTSMVDDGPLRGLMAKLGKRVEVAPSLIMVNEENCTFEYSWRWVARMLTWSRLYESTYFLSVIHAWFSNTVMIGLFLLLGLSIATQNWYSTTVATLALLLSGILSVSAYVNSRRAVERSCELSDRKLAPLSLTRLARLLIAVPLTQLVYLLASIKSSLSKRVNWREISYEIKSCNDIRMIEYRPFQQTAEQIKAQTSI
jgi:hypothetical protein